MKRTINYSIKPLTYNQDIEAIVKLVLQLENDRTEAEIRQHLKLMFEFSNYQCFGFYNEDALVGLSSAWTLVKLYSGKQLELDNVIIDHNQQSKGYGSIYFNLLEEWAIDNNYNHIELNTYINNSGSHKFYFNKGFKIKGYHFLKKLHKNQ